MGDAISHAVLPGLAAAFLLTGERQGWLMFIGAALVGVLTVLLTEFARQFGRVDEGASIGVVFTFLFALGLLIIVQAADRVDLDPDCVLYGELELAVLDQLDVFGWRVPRVALTLGGVTLLNLAFVVLLYRQLKVSTFDAQLAASQGVPVAALHYCLAAFVAVTAVAAFESVGNILVVAMFVVPPITAWLLTDRLPIMIGLSMVMGILAAVGGHLGSIAIATTFDYRGVNTAGMMAVTAGFLLVLTGLFAPRKGIVSRAIRSFQVWLQILGEDVLALLYRNEQMQQPSIDETALRKRLMVSALRTNVVLAWLRWRGLIRIKSRQLTLLPDGARKAQNIVRSHRLWEQYLALEAGMADELLHNGAEQLEHFTNRTLRERLLVETNKPLVDPHGSPIPPEA